MVAFIDESYQEVEKTGVYFTTYSAVCLSRDGSRTFSRDLCNLKRVFWKIDDPTEKELKEQLIMELGLLTLPNKEGIGDAKRIRDVTDEATHQSLIILR